MELIQMQVPNREGVLGVWMTHTHYGRLLKEAERAEDLRRHFQALLDHPEFIEGRPILANYIREGLAAAADK